MTRGPDMPGEDSSSVLRAIGSLLVALSGATQQDEPPNTQRLLVTLEDSMKPGRSSDRPADPVPTPQPMPQSQPQAQQLPATGDPGTDEEIELVLQDARDRAQQILDESTERARQLIREARARDLHTLDRDTVDELRESMSSLLIEIRDVQHRLTRIETLITTERSLRSSTPSGRAPAPSAPPTPEAKAQAAPFPTLSEPARPDPAPAPRRSDEGLSTPITSPPDAASPEPPAREEPPEPPVAPSAPAPAASPPRGFTVVTPEEAHDSPSTTSSPFDDDESAAPPSSAIPRIRYSSPSIAPVVEAGGDEWDDDADVPGRIEDHGADLATFLPEDGPILLRITPVAGFQGLMRIQDALARLPTVRQAAVEAYSQGEARLRLELLDTTDSDALAAGLSRALRSDATVQEVSESGRQLLIALR